MKRLPYHLTVAIVASVLGASAGRLARAQTDPDAAALAKQAEAQLDDATKARLAAADAGAKTIDVSGYPAAAQEGYEVFSKTCTKCHTLARPINSDYALPSEWVRYVKRMMHKPGSGITKAKGKQIYEFLAYDSNVRKSELWREKLEALSPEDRAKDEARIAKVRADMEGGG